MEETGGKADRAERLVADALMLAKGDFCSRHMALGSNVQSTSRYQFRSSQYNATVGLILVTSLPIVRSVMQKKRNVTHGSLRNGDRNSENETRERRHVRSERLPGVECCDVSALVSLCSSCRLGEKNL
jgi:hypothetical protein